MISSRCRPRTTGAETDIQVVDGALALHPNNLRLRLYCARLRLGSSATERDEALLRGALADATAVLATFPADVDALSIAEEASWGLGDFEAAIGHRAGVDEEGQRRQADAVMRLLFPAGAPVTPALTPLPDALRRRPGSTMRGWQRRQLVVSALTAAMVVTAAKAMELLVPALL